MLAATARGNPGSHLEEANEQQKVANDPVSGRRMLGAVHVVHSRVICRSSPGEYGNLRMRFRASFGFLGEDRTQNGTTEVRK
jgi:hypothetical protein